MSIQKRYTLFFCGVFYYATTILAQDGGGTMQPEPTPCITETQRFEIISMLKENEVFLKNNIGISNKQSSEITLFDWPLKQAPTFTDPGFYAITNYVDENKNFPNLLTDYNCGNRTYDLANGYNHQGTDIYSFPFSWNKMNNNAVQVIAAAAGTIIGKTDGNFDKNCAIGSGQWNAIYIQHADGSVAWYGHMKSGSLTSKGIGATVNKGEFLGVVGSSGSSTAPHLHFEVYTSNSYTTLVDPWAGSCNALNGLTSWWASQQPYHVPTLNKIQTHSLEPYPYGCEADEKTNFKNAFMSSDNIVFAFYFRDQEVSTTMNAIIYKPDNSVWTSWNRTFDTYYSSSYWYWTYILPSNAPTGTWKFVATYNGNTVTHNFTVGTVSSVKNDKNIPTISIYPNPSDKEVYLTINQELKVENVEIYNEEMQKISTQQVRSYLQNTTIYLNTEMYAKGLYFIILKNKNQEIVGQSRFVKQD